MSVFGFIPCLLCFVFGSTWNFWWPDSCHAQHIPCKLIQGTALCSDCQLLSVPRDLPENIVELQLNDNPIGKLQNSSLSGYPLLRSLSCARSFLNTIEMTVFHYAHHIEILNLAENSLHVGYQQTGWALHALTHLRFLDLSKNELTEDMLSFLLQNITSLEYLSVSGNVLLRLDETIFRDLHNLRELNLERNVLFEIDGAFDHLQKLQWLNLAFNQLPCLIKFQLTNLEWLNASHNAIEWFIANQDMEDTFQLETLDLSDNNLLFFPFLPKHSRIQNLLLSENRMSFYEYLADSAAPNWTTTMLFTNLIGNVSNVTAKLWDETLHGDVSSLELLDMSINQVTCLPQGFMSKLTSLMKLRLQTNCLTTLELTSDVLPASLHELDVSNNRLSALRSSRGLLNRLSNLTHLNLSFNDLQGLPSRLFSSLPRIRVVDLSYNRVGICSSEKDNADVEYSDCAVWRNIVSLRKLYLKGCNLGLLPPSVFNGTPMTHLELSDNPRIIIRQNSLTCISRNLLYLGLGNTGLQDFDFTPFPQLRSLNISRNAFAQISDSIENTDLRVLDLRDNKLTTIPSNQANILARQLHTIFLGGNPFNCCHLDWYKKFEELKTIEDRSELTCQQFNQGKHRVELIHSTACGERSEEPDWLYIVLFLPVCISFLGIISVFLLTFRPRLLPKVIKKTCHRPTSY